MSAVAISTPARDRVAKTTLDRIAPAIRKEILDRIRVGTPAGTAAVSCGVNRRTFQRWLEFGRRDDARDPYRTFARQVDEAFAEWQFSKVSEIDVHAAKDWRAGAWMLERLNPADFADPNRSGGPVNVTVTIAAERSAAADEMLAAALRALEGDPERLEVFLSELGGARVVEGEAVEVAELEA